MASAQQQLSRSPFSNKATFFSINIIYKCEKQLTQELILRELDRELIIEENLFSFHSSSSSTSLKRNNNFDLRASSQ